MTKGCSSIDRRKSAADKSMHSMLAFRLSALAIFAAAAFSAQGTVLVYEGFHTNDYGKVSATGNKTASDCTLTGNYTTGVTYGSNGKWAAQNGSQIKVFGANYGLGLPKVMTDAAFTAVGGSIGLNPSENSTALRAMYHNLVSQTLNVSSGTLYFRMLLNIDSADAGKLAKKAALSNADGGYFGFGFCTGSGVYVITANKASLAFVIWKNNDSQYVLSLAHTTATGTTLSSYPLVTGITLGSTYVCYAEVQIGVGANGEEVIRAGAVKADNFTGAAPWAMIGGSSDSVVVDLFSSSSYPTAMGVAGPYGTNGGRFRADEIVIGTEMKDILPVGGVFSVSSSGLTTVTTNAFSTGWILVADEGVTADAGLVWSTDETFATATTNLLGTGLAADTRPASLTNLDPDTTYWWFIYADNGSAVSETLVSSVHTAGAPALGSATATMTGQSAAFAVALSEAAMQNTLATSVSVFYGTNGVDWAEFPLGSFTTATNLSGTVESLGYGVKYQWFARATATMEGGRVLSAGTSTNSFVTLWNGDMYVDASSNTAAKPYKTPETAAKTISAAISAATDGATIHVAPGLYAISSPLEVRAGIRILGADPDPSRTIVSNTTATSNANQYKRVFTINHADAVVANLTMQKGEGYGSYHGGNFYIGSAGGIVSNCVVEAGYVRDNAVAAGAKLDAGIVTHTVFRKNRSGSGSASWSGNRPGVLELNGSSRIENCLFVANNQTVAVTMMNLNGSSVMRNCTIVDSSLAVTNASCPSWSALNIASGVTVQNVVIAGVTNKVDGAKCKPTGTLKKFINGALDSSTNGTTTTIFGTAESFFNDYANGDYTLNPTSLLVNAGANYEGMASVDLAGKNRKSGKIVDIGCYEFQFANGFFIMVR